MMHLCRFCNNAYFETKHVCFFVLNLGYGGLNKDSVSCSEKCMERYRFNRGSFAKRDFLGLKVPTALCLWEERGKAGLCPSKLTCVAGTDTAIFNPQLRFCTISSASAGVLRYQCCKCIHNLCQPQSLLFPELPFLHSLIQLGAQGRPVQGCRFCVVHLILDKI